MKTVLAYVIAIAMTAVCIAMIVAIQYVIYGPFYNELHRIFGLQ